MGHACFIFWFQGNPPVFLLLVKEAIPDQEELLNEQLSWRTGRQHRMKIQRAPTPHRKDPDPGSVIHRYLTLGLLFNFLA